MRNLGSASSYPFLSACEAGASDDRFVYIVLNDREERCATFVSLRSAGFEARSFGTIQDFIDACAGLTRGCVLLDFVSYGTRVAHLLSSLGDRRADFPTVAAIQQGDVVSAVRAIKLGAIDVVEVPPDYALLADLLDATFARLERGSSKREPVRNAREALRALTPRETDILRGLAEGLNNKQLAHRLGLSVRSVETNRASMMDRLQVPTLAAALRIAFEADVVPLITGVP